jgi:uncharacterized membrane protein YjjP (DUF1212 family)
MNNHPKSAEAAQLGNLLLFAGTALLKAGAGSSRIVKNISRLAEAYGYEANVELGTRYLSVTLHFDGETNIFSGSRSNAALPGANFKVIDAISRLSWAVKENNMDLHAAADELKKATQATEYPRIMVLVLVGIAGSSFCYTFGGHAIEMAITFLATVSGLFLRQELNRKKFNPYLVTYCSAVMASLIIGISWKAGIHSRLDHAFATSILFLIPGVPLINSIIDLMDGYITNGLDRRINGIMHAFAIASGLATIIYFFNVQG